jgi:hypothetical protein
MNDIYQLLFEGHLEKYCGLLCEIVFTPQRALAFLEGSFMVVLGSQKN